MKLSVDQVNYLRSYLQNSIRGGCSLCGNTNWEFDDVLFELRQFMGGGVSTEGLIKPTVAVTCSGCGHIILLNALATGVIRLEQPAASGESLTTAHPDDN